MHMHDLSLQLRDPMALHRGEAVLPTRIKVVRKNADEPEESSRKNLRKSYKQQRHDEKALQEV